MLTNGTPVLIAVACVRPAGLDVANPNAQIKRGDDQDGVQDVLGATAVYERPRSAGWTPR
jgi:hypothetical protein